MVELLAPAGNFISLRAVLENGADAVYFGLDDYNMRTNAKNFSLDDLAKISKIASEYGAKTYLCTNIILKEPQIEELKNNLENILKWIFNNLAMNQSETNVINLIALFYGLISRFKHYFDGNKEIFQIVFNLFTKLIQEHNAIKDEIISDFSCLIKHFGGYAICDFEMELLKTIIALSI